MLIRRHHCIDLNLSGRKYTLITISLFINLAAVFYWVSETAIYTLNINTSTLNFYRFHLFTTKHTPYAASHQTRLQVVQHVRYLCVLLKLATRLTRFILQKPPIDVLSQKRR